jgi:hypothetical protein
MPRFESLVVMPGLNRSPFRLLLCAALLVAALSVSSASAFGQFVVPAA